MNPAATRVAITGASGFIGTALAGALTASGHRVIRIGRGPESDVRWDPGAGTIDAGGLAGVDAVVHLAGATVAQRWTAAARREIRESRVRGTGLIARTCASLSPRPAVLVSGSAVGIYGSRGDEWLDERSTLGDDFLGTTARAWEAAAEPARAAGVRVVHPRIGIVLDPQGGALAKMLTPFRLGAGGPMGGGAQWMSWISLPDTVAAIGHAIRTLSITGPMNVVGPEPVTNATFAATLGRVLHRPALVPAPAFALRLLFGEMIAGTALASQRVRASALETSGFAFAHPTLESALRAVLGLA